MAAFGDWIQGPYFYTSFRKLGYSHAEIGYLLVLGLLSSLIFGSFVGLFPDRIPRKNLVILYSMTSTLSCFAMHTSISLIHLVGSVLAGISTSLLHSIFDSWLCEEHEDRGSSADEVSASFATKSFLNSSAAIMSGIVAQRTYEIFPLHHFNETFFVWGFTTPFDLAIISVQVSAFLSVFLFTEPCRIRPKQPLGASRIRLIQRFRNMELMLICLTESLFEAALYIFVFTWSRALSDAVGPTVDIDYGSIFSCFMAASILGSVLIGTFPVRNALFLSLCVAGMAHILSAMYSNQSVLLYASFIVFEITVGVFYPLLGELKARRVPAEIRVSAYNVFKIPMNAIVVLSLLSELSVGQSFILTSGLILCSTLSERLLCRSEVNRDPMNEKADS